MDQVQEIDDAIADGRRVGLAVCQFQSPPAARAEVYWERQRDRMIYRNGIEKGLEIAKSILAGELVSLPHWVE